MSQHEEQVLGGAGGLRLPVTETQGWELDDWGGIGSTTGEAKGLQAFLPVLAS